MGDVVIGAAALWPPGYNGVEKASAVDKLIEMVHLNETLYSCGIACSCERGCPTKAGNYQIDLLLANVCSRTSPASPMRSCALPRTSRAA